MEEEKKVPDDFLKIIYDIIEQICKNEEYHKKNMKKKEYGFLVNKKNFDEFKEYIYYTDLEKCVKDKKIFGNFKTSINTIKKFIKYKKLGKKITFTKFKGSQELVKDLCTNHNEYYLINNKFGNKIMELQKQNLAKEKEVEYKITRYSIYIYFQNNDNADFKFNENILIGEFNLTKETLSKNKIEESKNTNDINKEKVNQNENDSNEQIEKFKKEYKKHLEILIGIFYNYNEIQDKENNSFFEQNNDNKNKVCIINSTWIEKFKTFFEYKEIESHLSNFMKNRKINFDNFDSENEEIISNLPPKYINKMIEKYKNENINDINKIEKISDEDFKVNIEKNELNLKYLNNFQIINPKISGLLTICKYDYDQIRADLYFIENKKILLRFNSNASLNNGYCDEIGIFNESKIFIPQYILHYKGKIEDKFLIKFISDNIKNISRQCDSPSHILYNNDSIIVYCFSMEYIKLIKNKQIEEIKEEQNLNENDESKNENELNDNNQTTEKVNINTRQSPKIPLIHPNHHQLETKSHSNNYSNNTNDKKNNLYEQIAKNFNSIDYEKFVNKKHSKKDDSKNIKNESELSNKEENNRKEEKKEDNDEENKKIIEPIVEIILLMNMFEKELDKKLKETQISNDNKIEECILLKNEWIKKFKNIYINEEIKNSLINITSENVDLNIKSLFSSIKHKKDYIDKINKAKLNISSDDIFYFNTECLSKMLKNNDIFYPKEFYIINQNIYQKIFKLYKIDETNELNEITKNQIKYIINNGKIIFSYEYELSIEENDNNDKIYYNILICEKDKTSDKISPIVIQSFEDKKNEKDEQFNKYIKTPFILEKNVGDKEDGIVVKRPLKEKENEGNIIILINLYECVKNIRIRFNYEIKKSLNNSEEKEFYIVDKNWIKEFMEFFEFKQLITLFNQKENKSKDEFLSLIKNDEVINNKIRQKNNFNNEKYFVIEKKKFQNDNIKYFNNFELIDDDIKNLIEKLIDIKLEQKGTFLFGDNRFFAHFNNKNYLLIGEFNEEMAFISKFLIQFNNREYIDLYINEFKETNFDEYIKQFKDLNKNYYEKLPQSIGYIFIISKDDNINPIFNKKKIKEKSGNNSFIIKIKKKNNQNIFKDLQGKPIFLGRQTGNKLKIEQLVKKEMNRFKKQKEEEENKNENKSSNENEEGEDLNKLEGGQTEENDNGENLIENSNEKYEKLEPFDERQVKSLIKYYLFINELKKYIGKNATNNKIIKFDCYLINYNWMKEFKNFYLYDKLVECINQIVLNLNPDNSLNEQSIFENLSKDYLDNIITKKKLYDEQNFENLEKIKYPLSNLINNNEQTIKYPDKFEIISSEVYELIQQRKSVKLDLILKSCTLNSKKIILQVKGKTKNPFKILIGNYDFETNKFIHEILLNYEKEDAFIAHYNYLKKNSLENFFDKKTNNSHIIEKNKTVGYIYILNSGLKNEIRNENQNKSLQDQKKMINLIQNKNNIKFLFYLHFFLNILKCEINNNNSKNIQLQQCYLIKKELIDIYNNFYEVGYILKKCEANINKMIDSNDFDNLEIFYEQLIENHQKNIGNNKDIKDLNYQLNGKAYLFDVSPTQYQNENFKCFEDFIISDKDFEKNSNIYTFQYTIIEHKIILVFNHTINIGILDQNNYIFIPEAIIKFGTNEDFNDIINKIIKYGIHSFESNFEILNDNTNNSFLLLGNKDENAQRNKGPKINNFFNKNITQIMQQNSNERNFNTSKINNQMRLKKEQENEKKKIQSLKSVLSMMIDNEKIKRKMVQSLKGTKAEKYYLLNKKWFTKYITLKNMTEIINDLNEKQLIESYIINEINENNSQQYLYVIEEIIKNLDKNKIGKISSNDVYLSKLSDKNSYEVDWEYIIKDKEKNKCLVYYRDFILISYETKELLLSEFPSHYKFNLECCQVLLGNNKIFVIISTKNLIEVCHLDKKNDIQPIMFFEHNYSTDLNKNLNLLTLYDFVDYTKYFLLFNDDYISPIFDKNNNKIGQAYRYNEDLKNYSKYLSQEKMIKNMIKLYFSNFVLKTKFNNSIQEEKFYIIDEKYLKNFRIYTMIENSLNHFDLTMELNDIINGENSKYKFEELIEGKKMSLKTKKLISECKDIFSNQNDIVESHIPNLLPYNCNGNDFFYFDNFRLVGASLGNQLNESKTSMFKNLTAFNIVKCILIEKYILIDISNNNSNETFHQIYEVCEINEQNLIKPMYILAYYKSNYFINHIKHIVNNVGLIFQNFLEGVSPQQGNGIELSIETRSGEIKVGFVYKLSLVFQNQNQILPSNNNISINNSNINIINNNNPNININISCNPSFPNFNPPNNNNNINNHNNINFGQNQIIQNINPIPLPIPRPDQDQDPGPIDSINKEYTIHPLVGLKNVGATCYMNATLQCFLNLKKFVNFFKYKLKSENLRQIKYKTNTNLTESFKYLIENVWMTPGNNYYIPRYNSKNSNNRYFIPKEFKEKISTMNPLFEGAQANDAKDLVNFLIMTLHEELNRAQNKKNVNSSNILIDQSNRDLVLKNFSECFVNENMSFISDQFYAMNNNITECCNCNRKKYNFQVYFFLNFPLEEVRKFKIQMQVDQFCQSNQNLFMMNQMMFQQNVSTFQNNLNNTIKSVNLDDCFLYNQKIEAFSGPNAMYCNSCKIQANAFYRTLLSTGPEILVIILNRGKGKEFDVKCDFVQQLNLSEYIEMKNTGFMYDLVGVVTHMGESGGSGHFIAVCRSPIDQKWYKYNDDLVFPVGDFVSEVINYAMPYILFYQKIENK